MSEPLFPILQTAVADARPGEPLSDHTTIRVGGPARLMVFPVDEKGLTAVLRALANSPVEWAALGGGANIFADSQGFDGVIVNLSRWRWDLSLDQGLLVAGGGLDMREVALAAARQGWCGVDYMSVVPGTVGGAVRINAGTHSEGGYVADRFEWCETLTPAGEKRRYSTAEMEFGYRTSLLLNSSEIVTRAAFRLERCEESGTTPEGLLERFDAFLAARGKKFPLDLPNFGSTFRSPGAPFPPAGKLIDDLGMKGLQAGSARISERHANFIVNLGGAVSDDVLALMRRMHDAVLEKHGVRLWPEVHYLANKSRPRPEFFRIE